MGKSEYLTEDFVLDPEFRKWILDNDPEAKSYWEEFMRIHEDKVDDIQEARKILVNLTREKHILKKGEVDKLWDAIDSRIDAIEEEKQATKVVPLDSWAAIQKFKAELDSRRKRNFWRGLVASLLILGSLGGFFWAQHRDVNQGSPAPQLVYEFHETPTGVKSTIALQDGSKVFLNSGSSIRYEKNFSGGSRLIELSGEAFFEVARDTINPFIVKTDQVTTTALGTSFNITAYQDEPIAIALLSGSVQVKDADNHEKEEKLTPGEGVVIINTTADWKKRKFNAEMTLAWMDKTIIFDKTPFNEVVRTLENWFGVKIEISGVRKGLTLSGKFKDETLENILEGLGFDARFSYKIEGKTVNIQFNP